MEYGQDNHGIDERQVLDLLKVDKAIQRTIKVAEKDFERGGKGFAKVFFPIPSQARGVLAGWYYKMVEDIINPAIRSTTYVRSGSATIWSQPGRFLPGQYSIELYINT